MVGKLAMQASAVDESYICSSRASRRAGIPLGAINMVIDACAILNDLDRAFAMGGAHSSD